MMGHRHVARLKTEAMLHMRKHVAARLGANLLAISADTAAHAAQREGPQNMGKESTPPPIPTPKFSDKTDRQGNPKQPHKG